MRIIFIILLSLVVQLSAIPKLVNVHLNCGDSLVINWNIIDPEPGMMIDLGGYNKTSKELVKFTAMNIVGDFGEIQTKSDYYLSINLTEMEENFIFEDYIIFPKLIFNDRIYYEMVLIRSSSEQINIIDNVISTSSSGNEFFCSLFEVTNEQYLQFVNSDGYDIESYWKIAKDIMANPEVGWNYQAKLHMSKPKGWDFSQQYPFAKAESNFIYGPVTFVRWFEALAFVNWMEVSLPNYNQQRTIFKRCIYNSDQQYAGIFYFIDGSFPLQNVSGGVAEWMGSGEPSLDASCGAGCNEMYLMKNIDSGSPKKFEKMVKCPLYRNANLGFRYIHP